MSDQDPPQQAAAPEPNAPLEADTQENNDVDSAFGDPSETYTASLTSSVRDYVYENGRRYHAYREGEYPLPNDEKEQDRLDLLHHIFKLLTGGQLFRAPIPRNLHRVLDIGTGTGIWAIDFADEFPSASVIGTDLSPIQPQWVPPNLSFIVDDAEAEWTYPPSEAFDFIHGRALAGSIGDWSRLYRQAYTHLKPGGWLEVQEYETWAKSDDVVLQETAPSLYEWQSTVDQASAVFGKQLNVADSQKQKLIDAGFVHVTDDIYKVPVGPWPRNSRSKEVGRYELLHMLDAVEPFTLALFTRTLGWSRERCEALMAGVRADFRNSKNHIYSNFHFVYGRKPEVAAST